MERCPICFTNAHVHKMQSDLWLVDCPRCDRFQTTWEVTINTRDMGQQLRKNTIISSQIRKLPKDLVVNLDVYERLSKAKDISFVDKATKFIQYLSIITHYAGEEVNIENPPHAAMGESWAMNFEELHYIASYLQDEKRIKFSIRGSYFHITILHAGWRYLEETQNQQTTSNQGFVAMWFDKDMLHVYDEAIAKAISDTNHSPHRVDLKEHIDKIDDEIIRQIRRSKFIIADATGNRGGVYYEAGFAMGLGLPVFWTCQSGHDLHFDVRQYNCIFWSREDLPQFRLALSRRIEAVIGRHNL